MVFKLLQGTCVPLDKAGKLLSELWTVYSGFCAVYISAVQLIPGTNASI